MIVGSIKENITLEKRVSLTPESAKNIIGLGLKVCVEKGYAKNIDIHYNSHLDNLSYQDYLEFTGQWMKKCFALSKNDGRFLLNIPLDKNKV